MEKHKSLFWSLLLQFANHGFSIVLTIILANILTPSDFGLVAMVLVISEFSRIILEFGFGQALIFKQNVQKVDYNSVFWFNVILGGLLTLIVLLSAKYFAFFYKQPILKPITMVLSLNYFFASFSIVPQIIFTKKLDFKSLTKIRLGGVIISGIIGVWLSTSFGIWALVFIEVSRTLLISIFSIALVKDWKPEFSFQIQSLKSLYKFSINLFGNETLNYWMDNFDKLIIGRILGEFSLGLYRQAYSFMLLPVNNISRVLNSVLFPILSEKQTDKKYISSTFIKSFSSIMLIIFPALTFLFVSAKPLTNLLLGNKWSEMIIILQYFSIAGIFYSLSELSNSFFLSLGKTDKLFRSNIIIRILLIITILFALKFKLEGVTIAILIISPLKFLILLYSLNQQLNIKVQVIIIKIIKHFIFSIIIAISLLFADSYFSPLLNIYLIIILNIIALFCLFIIVFVLFFKEDLNFFLYHSKKILKIKSRLTF